mmetsp:Transcript_8479/g.11172  ORF Transcript_8479/g.11172 Transcript_8479/m.11172 type:complete len:104 (+) Transcript_8479:1139-1450(+)
MVHVISTASSIDGFAVKGDFRTLHRTDMSLADKQADDRIMVKRFILVCSGSNTFLGNSVTPSCWSSISRHNRTEFDSSSIQQRWFGYPIEERPLGQQTNRSKE